MKFKLYEYNATPDVDKKDITLIEINDNKITYNGNDIENTEIINKINDLLLNYKETLLEIKDIRQANIKGGRQKTITIYSENICGNKITLIGNTSDEKISSLYEELKNKIIALLNNN